jgi:SAM-dependent methyltransferase
LIEQQIKQFYALNEWFQSSLGLSVADEFRKQLSPVLDYLKGETLLQLGSCSRNSWLDDLQFTNKWIASPFSIDKKNSLISSLNQIPLQRNSIDCIVAPLTMEPFDNSLNLIDEIDRILKPMGYVVFLCFNPWSLWGGAMKCGLLNCYAEKKLKMHTPFHLNRIFLQRGYRQCSLNNFYYIPPVNNKSLLNKLSFFNEVGKMLWPFPSGFYCYIAQKYEPISPSLDVQAVIRVISKDYDSPLQAIN